MHIYTLQCEMLTKCSIDEAFAIFKDPYNLARITPDWMHFQIVSKERIEMRAGAEIDYVIHWLGLPMRWKTLITEYEPPFHFVDEQAKGPYSLWRHRHTFEVTEHGTKVGDRVEYALPFGPFGRLAHALMVRKQLEGIFEYRQQKIREMLGNV